VTMDDYRAIRELLQCRLIHVCDGYNPLSAAMVNRANAYLAVYAGNTNGSDKANGLAPVVTRGELTNLGNICSKTVRDLISHLQKRGSDGERLFKLCGTAGKMPSWSNALPAELAKSWMPWTEKQVRTHFGRLLTENVITGQRDGPGGAWQNRLPEAMVDKTTPFAGLPDPNAIEALLTSDADCQNTRAGTSQSTPSSCASKSVDCPENCVPEEDPP
jgi:hypothetical protein